MPLRSLADPADAAVLRRSRWPRSAVVYLYVIAAARSPRCATQKLRLAAQRSARAYSRRDRQRAIDRATRRDQVHRRARAPRGRRVERARDAARRQRAARRACRPTPASDSTAERDISDLQFAVAADAARTRPPAARHRGRRRRPRRRGRRAADSAARGAGDVPLRGRLLGAARRRRRQRRADPPPDPRRRRASRCSSRCSPASLVARALSRRVRRLERAAAPRRRAATSRARFRPTRDDELGQLAQTLDDMQRQLAAARRRARKRFIATASHELRTPIFSLGGFLELLEDEELDEETRRAVRRASCASRSTRLRKLATDLLDLSRLEAGSLELRPEPTDLGELARDRRRRVHARARRRTTRTSSCAWPREPIEAVCDPERVAQILRILIDNALHAHARRAPTSSSRASATNGRVRARGARLRHRASSATHARPRSSSPSSPPTTRRAPASASRSRASSPSAWTGACAPRASPGRTTFSLELPA